MIPSLIINIDVPEIDAAVAFYESGLGFRFRRMLFDRTVAELDYSACRIFLIRKLAGSISVPGTSKARDYSSHWTPVHFDLAVANSARELGEALHSTIAKLRLPNSESVAADHVTASVAAVTGLVKGSIERVHLLTQAIAKVQDAAGAGGNRVLALSV